jgi:EARP and GARP complex-interacting protein 1
LWRIASCSSAPWLGSDDLDSGAQTDKGEGNSDPPDIKVRGIDQHEESVYAVAWSPADAWMYTSLSYDGRVILNHVPSTEKYKILL